MNWSEALEILQEMSKECQQHKALESLLREFYAAAIRYAHFRSEWALADRDTRVRMDRPRRVAHDALIDSVNVLSRQMRARGKSNSWRARLGDERAAIGDLACIATALLGIAGSLPFR